MECACELVGRIDLLVIFLSVFVVYEDVIAGPAGVEVIARSALVRPGLPGVTKPQARTLLTALRRVRTVASAIMKRDDAPVWVASPVLRAKEATVHGAVRGTGTVAVCPTTPRITAVTSRSSTSTMM